MTENANLDFGGEVSLTQFACLTQCGRCRQRLVNAALCCVF